MGSRHLPRTLTAVAATAVVGSLGTDVSSAWYRSLDTPPWQPPGPVFGLVWTPLYGLVAAGSARALDRATGSERRALARSLGANLVLNAGWSWFFFRAHRPALALAEVVVLEVSTVDLVRRAHHVDAAAGRTLVPYAAWVGFATALTAAIARRNPRSRP